MKVSLSMTLSTIASEKDLQFLRSWELSGGVGSLQDVAMEQLLSQGIALSAFSPFLFLQT